MINPVLKPYRGRLRRCLALMITLTILGMTIPQDLKVIVAVPWFIFLLATFWHWMLYGDKKKELKSWLEQD
jgi:hypothetical protein